MSELGDRAVALKNALAAALPARAVTREYDLLENRLRADLEKGLYSILSFGERGFTNVSGYEAEDGRQSIVIVFQFVAADDKAAGDAIEDAEFTAIDEIKAFCRNLPASLCMLNLLRTVQSGQQDRPFGWVVFHLEYAP